MASMCMLSTVAVGSVNPDDDNGILVNPDIGILVNPDIGILVNPDDDNHIGILVIGMMIMLVIRNMAMMMMLALNLIGHGHCDDDFDLGFDR